MTKKNIKNNGEQPQYYVQGAHKALIDEEIWECVQLEKARRKRYAMEHNVYVSSNRGDTYPFTGKLVCKECGYTFGLFYTNRVADAGMPSWNCRSYKKLRGTTERNALKCHNLRLHYSAPEAAFVQAWNELVANPALIENFPEADVLQRYRKGKLIRLVETIGWIETPSYELVIRTLDHFEVDRDGTMRVVWLGDH